MEESETNVPASGMAWQIGYADKFCYGAMLCVFIMGLSFIIFLVSGNVTFILIAVYFMFISVAIFFIYEFIRGFAKVAKELGEGLVGTKTLKWNIVRYSTKTYGEFTLRHEMGGSYTTGYFVLLIYTTKIPPEIKDEDVEDILRKNFFYSNYREAPLSDFVPRRNALAITSLSEIKFQYGDKANISRNGCD